jgi:hypothetical protein
MANLARQFQIDNPEKEELQDDLSQFTIQVPIPHDKQWAFINSTAKRKVIKAGRRGGKTVGAAEIAVEQFLKGHRVLYATPTGDQILKFWTEVTIALTELINAGIVKKNETEHSLTLRGTEARIRAKTAWNADTLRGDYADVLILDEFQMMNEDTWAVVGAPMLLDNNGDAIFIFTPPSLHTRSVSKADDPRHASKLYEKAVAEMELAKMEGRKSRWEAFHFTSHDNPHLSKEALTDITLDMTSLAYRQEIMAEDVDSAPGALWQRSEIDADRVVKMPELDLIYVGVDPSASSEGDEAGIVVAGRKGNEYYVFGDYSLQGSPNAWAKEAVAAYTKHLADKIIAEKNNGGEMVSQVIHEVDKDVPVFLTFASRGKETRAQPIATIYEQHRVHHVGTFSKLEDELCLWCPGDKSPNRLDALVWALNELKGNVKAAQKSNHPDNGDGKEGVEVPGELRSRIVNGKLEFKYKPQKRHEYSH